MQNILNLVKVLNAFGATENVEMGSVHIELKDAEGKYLSSYVIKKRTVADKDGVQHWAFVAREGKE